MAPSIGGSSPPGTGTRTRSRALDRHLDRPAPPRGRQGRGRVVGGSGLAGGPLAGRPALRSHLDLHRPARPAKKCLRTTNTALADHLHDGGLVVGLEPSCLAVLRSGATELLGDDLDAARLSAQRVSLAEVLLDHTPGWRPPRLNGVHGVAQVRHHHAVLGWEADRRLLEATGASIERLGPGRCGLAGNLGLEPGHLEVSKACAWQVLLPALRASAPDHVVLADGFSTTGLAAGPARATPASARSPVPGRPWPCSGGSHGSCRCKGAGGRAGRSRRLRRDLRP